MVLFGRFSLSSMFNDNYIKNFVFSTIFVCFHISSRFVWENSYLSVTRSLLRIYLSMCWQWLAITPYSSLFWFFECVAATGNTFKCYFIVYFTVALEISRTSRSKRFMELTKYKLTRQLKQLKCEPFCTFLQIISFNEFRLLSDGEIFCSDVKNSYLKNGRWPKHTLKAPTQIFVATVFFPLFGTR